LELTGPALPAVESVSTQANSGTAQFAVSQTGTFTYLAGTNLGNESPVMWRSRDGKTAPLLLKPSNWGNPRFSPDGQKLALDFFEWQLRRVGLRMGARYPNAVDS
jgi:hypothetical protein